MEIVQKYVSDVVVNLSEKPAATNMVYLDYEFRRLL
jgi:hypothetical protein